MGNFNNGGFSPSNTVVTDLEVDEGTISVDTANNFVGIGTTSPKTELTVEGVITVKERAAANATDTAAYGQLWVKSDAPTSLYFTTDAGADIQITSGTSLAGVAGSLSGLGSTDNILLRTSGTGGETAQGSGIAIDDSNNASGMGTLACGAITTSGVLDITIATDSSNATGDTGALRTEGGASIAKKLYVGTDLDVNGTANLDNTDIDGTFTMDGTAFDVNSTTTCAIDNTNTSNGVTINTVTSGGPISIGHATSETTVNDNLTVTGNLAINGASTTITDTTASSATEGGFIRLASNDGAAMADDHRLGVIEFAGAEDASNNITVGAKIEAICDAGWSASENGAALVMSTTDANASQSEVLRLDSDKLATFAGAALVNGNATFGVDATGVDVRMFSNTTNEGVFYDASEDELGLLLTTKLKFHDIGGGEEIYASEDGRLEVNAGTILDMTAPTLDLNAVTKVQFDTPIVQLFSGITNKPLLSLECTNPDALGGIFQFVKNGASVADNDVVGTIKFISEDDGSVVHAYSTIVTTIDDMTGGQESGKLKLSVASHDGDIEQGLLLAGGSVDAEVDVTLGNGTASVTAVVGNLTVGDDLSLTTDSAVLNMGVGNDITFTHDGTTGLTIAATPISIDSTGELHLNSTTGDIKLQDGGDDQIIFDLDGTGGQVIMKAAVDDDDIVFSQYDGTECARIRDGAGNMPTNLQGLASGLGYRRPVAVAAAPDADVAISLTAAESGQLILCDAGANSQHSHYLQSRLTPRQGSHILLCRWRMLLAASQS